MPVTSSDPSSVVSAGVWLTTGNVYTSNNTYATDSGAAQNTEYAFEVGGFANLQTIQANATVQSVTVTIEAKAGTNNRAQIKGELYDGATPITGSLALTNLTNADANYTFSPTPTLAQLKSANLKVKVTNKRIVSQANVTSVDWVKIDVTWVGLSHTGGGTDPVGVTDSVSTSVTTTVPKIGTLTDAFDTLDTGKWSTFGANVPAVVSGRLEIPIAGSGWSGIWSVNNYDLTESSIIVRCWPQSVGLGGRETNFRLENDAATSWIGFVVAGGNPWLVMVLREDSVDDNTVDYSDIATHAWFRIRLSGTTAYWDTSPNGLNWTNMRSRTVAPSKFTNLGINLSSGQGTDLGPSVAYFDNINVPPSNPKIATVVDTFDTQLDPATWPIVANGPVWEAGRIRLGMTGTQYCGFATAYAYDATNSSVSAKITPPPGAYSREIAIGLEVAPGNDSGASILIFGGSGAEPVRRIITRRREGGVNYNSVFAEYDPAKHAYVRIRMVGSTQFRYDYSPDGVNWTDFGVAGNTALNMTACKIICQSGQWEAEADSPQYGYIDNVNATSALPKIDTLVDTFDTEISRYRWTPKDANVAWSAGRAALTTYTADPWYSRLSALEPYDLRESSFICKMTPPPVYRESREFSLMIMDGDNVNNASIFALGGIGGPLLFRNREDGVNYNSAYITYDPVAHAWWRIRLLAGTLYYDTSPDGLTWTNLWYRTPASTAPFAAVMPVYECGQWQAEADNGTGYVDNVNAPPAGGGQALTSNLSDTVGIIDTETESTGKAASDQVGIYDAYAGASGRAAAAQDTNGLRDSASTDAAASRSDAVPLTDSVQAAFALAAPVADSTSVTDAVACEKSLAVDRQDPVQLADSTTEHSDRSAVDTLSITDSGTESLNRNSTDTVAITDTVAVSTARVRDQADPVPVTDAAATLRVYDRAATDPVPITDSVATTKSSPGDFADLAGLTDSIVTAAVYIRAYSDTVPPTDYGAKVLGRPFTDTASVTDSIARGMARSYADTVPLIDPFARGLGRGAADLARITDTVTATKGAPGRPKVWTGAAHTSKPGKWWNGSQWLEKPWKHWDGTQWKPAK